MNVSKTPRVPLSLLLSALAIGGCPAGDDGNAETEVSTTGTSATDTSTADTSTQTGTTGGTGSTTGADTTTGTDTDAPGSAFDAAVEALGGADALTGLTTLRFEASATRWFTHEGVVPGERVDLSTSTGSVLHALGTDDLRIDMQRQPLFEATQFFPPADLALVLDEQIGGLTDPTGVTPSGALASQNVGALRSQYRLMNPHLFLIAGLEDPCLVSDTVVPVDVDGVPHTAVTIATAVADARLLVDDATGLITQLETTENHLLTRDSSLVVRYADWQDAEGLRFPASVELSVDGQLTHQQTRSAFTTQPDIDPGAFDLPPEAGEPVVDRELFEWGHASHEMFDQFFQLGMAFAGTQPITPMDLAPGVTWLNAGPVGCSSMAVEVAGGVVVIEAPNSPDNGDELIATVQAAYPGLDITHIVSSHHHQDHAAGVRSFVAVGAELVVGHGVVDFWDEILAAPSTIRPDTLANTQGIVPTVTELPPEGSWTIEDQNTRLTAYHAPNNPHAADMLIVEVETGGQRFVYEGDLYNAGNGFTVVLGGQAALFGSMRDIGLIDGTCAPAVPTTIVPSHGVPLSVEDSVAELGMLGVDLGCL